jgi:prevent-host-death family protein
MPGLLSAKDVRQGFSECVSRVAFGKERIVITRNRKELVAMVPLEDYQLLEQLEDRVLLEEARRTIAEGAATTPWTEVRPGLGL